MENIFYHVVTERPMKLNQVIKFDTNHHSGVYNRVNKYKNLVEQIYNCPTKYCDKELSYPLKVTIRELALEEVRQKNIPIILLECHLCMFQKQKRKQ